MELQIKITLSDRFFDLLEDKLPNLGRRVEKVLTKEVSKQVREQSQIKVTVTSSDAPPEPEQTANADKSDTSDRSDLSDSSDSSDLSEAAPADVTAEAKPRNLTQEIRDIMHCTRMRFEGPDYKNSPDSEGYVKYHNALKIHFRNIATVLGYTKPSLIDTPEKVDAFIRECNDLILDDNGNIVSKPASY